MDVESDPWCAYAKCLRHDLKLCTNLVLDFGNLQACLDVAQKYKAWQGKDDTTKCFDYESFLWDYLGDENATPFPRLTSLTVSGLHLATGISNRKGSELIKFFTQLKNIEKLGINGYCPFIDSMQFWNMDKLQEVCLDSASIHSLSPSIGNLKFLKHLSLNANALSDLPITLGFCQNLKTLSLDANSFSYIPSAILMINNFKHLSITGNPLVRCVQNVPLKELAAIPYTLASLPVISTSSVLLNYMDHWRLDSLVHKELEMLNYPMSKVALCGWCSQQILQEHAVEVFLALYLGLCNVPVQLQTCSTKCLQKLVLHLNEQNLDDKNCVLDNDPVTVHPSAYNLPSGTERMLSESVVELDLSGTCIKNSLQGRCQVWEMTSVKKLSLDHTNISSLSPSVGKMKTLEILSLESNSLSDLPLTLEYCQKLIGLNLKENHFAFIPGVVLKLRNLKELKHSIIPAKGCEQSVQAMFPGPSAQTYQSPSSLQSICMATVIVNHIDYWHPRNGTSEQWVAAANNLASSITLCHRCGSLISQEYAVKVSLHSYHGTDVVPFLLKACNVKCHQEMASCLMEQNGATSKLNTLKKGTILCESEGSSILFIYNDAFDMGRIIQFERFVKMDISSVDIPNDLQSDFQFWSMPNLKSLYLNSIGMHILHHSIGKLKTLEVLSLHHNNLSHLPLTLAFCQCLTVLNITHNSFKVLPGCILRLKNLKELRATTDNNLLYKYTFTSPKLSPDHLYSLQDLCSGAIFSKYVNYWKLGSPMQCKALDQLVSTSFLCDSCGVPMTDDYTTMTIPISLPDLGSLSFRLFACSARCEGELEKYRQDSVMADVECVPNAKIGKSRGVMINPRLPNIQKETCPKAANNKGCHMM